MFDIGDRVRVSRGSWRRNPPLEVGIVEDIEYEGDGQYSLNVSFPNSPDDTFEESELEHAPKFTHPRLLK